MEAQQASSQGEMLLLVWDSTLRPPGLERTRKKCEMGPGCCSMVRSWWSGVMSVRKAIQNGSILEVPRARQADGRDVGDEGKGEIGRGTPRSLA